MREKMTGSSKEETLLESEILEHNKIEEVSGRLRVEMLLNLVTAKKLLEVAYVAGYGPSIAKAGSDADELNEHNKFEGWRSEVGAFLSRPISPSNPPIPEALEKREVL